jgi:hypothetical protein
LAAAVDRYVEAVRERLHEFGIALEIDARDTQGLGQHIDVGVDAVATLSRAKASARYAVAAKEPMTLSSVARDAPASLPYPLLIIGDHISRRSAAAFRDANIQFIDSLGNAFITFGSVLVEVQGRTQPPDRSHRSAGRSQPTNIFSPRRSQVILALLAWPQLVTGNVREIAEAAGISVGQAHDALVQLEKAGFIMPSSRRLIRAGELLDYWAAAYPTGLGRRLEIARFHGDPSRRITGPYAEHSIYLSGEAARGTDIARPATLTVYLDVLDPKLPLMNRWTSNPERPPNVFVRHKFWTSPHPAEEEPSAEGRNAPWPLVYADLLAAGDARLREAARTWRSRHARSAEV